MSNVITTTFERDGRVLLSTSCALILRGRLLGSIGNVPVYESVRFLDPSDARCGSDNSIAGFGGSYSVISRNAAGEIVGLAAVSTSEKLARFHGAKLVR